MSNTLFNPPDKRKTRRQILTEHCEKNIIPQQKKNIKYFKTKPDEYVIRDKNNEYKIVSKNYYIYHIQEDEYDTDAELMDEDDYNEELRIKNKYNKRI